VVDVAAKDRRLERLRERHLSPLYGTVRDDYANAPGDVAAASRRGSGPYAVLLRTRARISGNAAPLSRVAQCRSADFVNGRRSARVLGVNPSSRAAVVGVDKGRSVRLAARELNPFSRILRSGSDTRGPSGGRRTSVGLHARVPRRRRAYVARLDQIQRAQR
jgi:hypothetical protein